jgi:hypothetical protein
MYNFIKNLFLTYFSSIYSTFYKKKNYIFLFILPRKKLKLNSQIRGIVTSSNFGGDIKNHFNKR